MTSDMLNQFVVLLLELKCMFTVIHKSLHSICAQWHAIPNETSSVFFYLSQWYKTYYTLENKIFKNLYTMLHFLTKTFHK